VGALAHRRLPAAAVAGTPSSSSGSRRGALAHAAAEAVKHRLYAHGEKRNEWLRGPSRKYVEDILLSDRLAERGLLRPDRVRRLWDEHLRGADHGDSLGLLLGIELWQRFFVDRDRPPSLARESGEEP
jgi:hypothetical protein